MRNLLYLFLVGFSFAFPMDQEGTSAQKGAGAGAASVASTPPKMCISISPTPPQNPDGKVNVHYKPVDQATDKTSPTKLRRLSITDVEKALNLPLSSLQLGDDGEEFPTIPQQPIYPGYKAGEEVPNARTVLAAQIEHQRRRSAELEEIEEACAAIQRFFKELE